ncbi:redox-active disulfide protein 2 [Spirosoma spitsbergense]|uniref:redox-active disulfide protein 2 n=1 Tax=Spirosoma spitsbergense TaxID=431554 RepID=UPI001FDFC198|nr:redox-active disulfide protein 2 [Spirosoma spitsbergense]
MKIQEMSNEALLKRKKTTEVVTATLAGLLTVLLIAAIFLCFKNQSSIGLPLLIIPLALSPILYININDVKVVKGELQTRKQVL